MTKTQLFTVILAATFHLGLFSLGAAAQGNRNADLVKTLREYDEAWNRKDVAGVSKILAADYSYFTSTGSVLDRKQSIAFLASPDYKLTFAERSEVELLSVDKRRGIAIVSSRWKGRGSFGNETINDDQRCGLVFVKENTQWKLVSEHCVQIIAK